MLLGQELAGEENRFHRREVRVTAPELAWGDAKRSSCRQPIRPDPGRAIGAPFLERPRRDVHSHHPACGTTLRLLVVHEVISRSSGWRCLLGDGRVGDDVSGFGLPFSGR